MKTLIAVLLLTAASFAQTATGGVTFSQAATPPPPPQPQITNGAPPAGTSGSAYSFQFTACCGTPGYTWSSAGSLPAGTTLTSGGLLSGTLGTPGTYAFNVTVTDSLGQTAGNPYSVIIAPTTPPTITSGNPSGGNVGVAYSFPFTATGANPPFVFSLHSGAFPAGLSLVGNTLQGTPTTPCTCTFSVRVTDNLSVTADSPVYTVVILPSAPVITSSFPPGGTTGNTYSFQFTASSGTAPYTWSSTGSLPAGLTLNSSTGLLSGTLGVANTYNFVIIVTDAAAQTGSAAYSILVQPQTVGTSATLPQSWPNSHECDGQTTNTIAFPADGLNMHGGTPYANTFAGFQQAINDANTKRDTDGSGTDIKMPHGTVYQTSSTMILPGPNSTTGLNSHNCIIVESNTPLPANQTVCSHGTREINRNPGCANDKPSMWVLSGLNSNTPLISCNTPGSQGPPHHFLIQNGEIRYDSTGLVAQTSGVALAYCGTNNENSESLQPNHMHWTGNYFHGYDTPEISAPRVLFYSMHDSSFSYNYSEMIHWAGAGEGQIVATQQSSRILILANWNEGGVEGSMIGGGAAVIPGYIPSDFIFRRNMFTLDPAYQALSHQGLTKWGFKNRFEIKDAQRVLIDGNTFTQSWADGQAGFLLLMNVRACSTNGCNGGNQSTVSDITMTNNLFAHSAQLIQTDAAAGGTGNGNGVSQKGRRWVIQNNLAYDIGDWTRFRMNGTGTASQSIAIQLGSSGNALTCSLTRNGAGTIATAVCTSSQTNVIGTGMAVGDPVKLTGCSPDTGFNVGASTLGPPVLTGAYNSLTFSFANTGAAGGTASCTLDNSVGAPENVTINHNSIFMANNSSSFFITLGASPTLKFVESNTFTNNIFASNGGNPGGFGGSGGLEGTGELNLWDTSSLQFNCNILTGRKSSVYTLYQTGQCANSFIGNNVGGANNQTGIVCPNGGPTSTCLGVNGAMNGIAYNSNPSDYHELALRLDSNWNAGNAGQASDSLQMGSNINQIDQAIDSLFYTCQTPCGTGPFPDAAAAFMVQSGGDNVDGCTYQKPCDSFTAMRTAVQGLPTNAQVAILRGGTYRLGATVAFDTTDSGEPQEDLLNWWCTPYPTRTTNHLNGPGTNSYCWLDADEQKMWLLKSSTGNPWDVHIYDNANVSFWLTENNDICLFTDAHCWKRKVTPTPISPRFFTPGTTAYRLSVGPAGQSNPGQPTGNCDTDHLPTTYLGDILGLTTGPTTIAWGNSVGTQPTILVQYFYSGSNGSYNSRERYWLTKTFGWVQWDHATCSGGSCFPTTGVYNVDQTTTKTTLVAGGAPTPNFPCGTAFTWWVGATTVGAGGNVATYGGMAAPQNQVTWRNYPGEVPTITGNKQVSGFSNSGSCGTNCQDWTVTQSAASWKNYEALYYNGTRRPRPQYAGATPLHGYAPNACPTSAGSDAFLCVTGVSGGGCTVGTAQQIADCQCGCPTGVASCANNSQTKACSGGNYQCFNHYKVNSGDVNASWHALNVGDVELLDFETWTLARMRVSAVSGQNVSFTGSTQQTNDHGCQGGHQYLMENVKEFAQKGQWYLDHCPTNACGGTPSVPVYEANWTLHVYADTSIGENPSTADIEVPQLDPVSPQLMTGNANSNMTFQNLTFSGDNWFPAQVGLGDGQGSPLVTSQTSWTGSNYLLFDTDTWQQGTGFAVTFQAGGSHDTIQNSHCSDMGAGCFRFETGSAGKVAAQASDTDLNVPQYGTVLNNLCDHMQRVVPSGYGGCFFLGDGHHFLVSHNESAYSYTGGFELGFGLKRDPSGTAFFIHDNVVSYNLCYGQPNALMADFGCIYSAPSFSSVCPAGTPLTGNPCNSIVNNYIHDMYNNYDMTGSAASSGARGIYCDQGCTNMLVQNNLVLRTGQSGIFLNDPEHTGANHWLTQNNLVDNNIFAYNGYVNPAFAVNLATGCIAKNGDNASAFTFQHNICYQDFSTTLGHMQNLTGPWPCFADDGTQLTTPAACTTRFTFASNVYFNRAAGNILAFATCATTACAAPFNNTNYFRYIGTLPTQIPAAWTNAWQANGSAAGEDAGSTAADPLFVNPTYPTDNYNYGVSFLNRGIKVFDYTQAGRMPTNTFNIPNVPDMFPVRPVNPATDF